jgi:ATP-dependent RNA helicase DDX54/DBP10
MVKTESGIKLPATYRSGRFDEWKSKNRVSLPKIGEAEGDTSKRFATGRKFKHTQTKDAKPLDKFAEDYERKVRQNKKRSEAQGDVAAPRGPNTKGRPPAKGKSRYGSKSVGRVKSELKSVEQIRKERNSVEKRRAKNARPSRKKGKR